jgi:hypothetical protein
MMLTKAGDINVTNNDHLVVVLCKNGIIDNVYYLEKRSIEGSTTCEANCTC